VLLLATTNLGTGFCLSLHFPPLFSVVLPAAVPDTTTAATAAAAQARLCLFVLRGKVVKLRHQ